MKREIKDEEVKRLLMNSRADLIDWYQMKEEELTKKRKKRRNLLIGSLAAAAAVVLLLLGSIAVRNARHSASANPDEETGISGNSGEGMREKVLKKAIEKTENQRWFTKLFSEGATEPVTIVVTRYEEAFSQCYLIPGNQEILYGPDTDPDVMLNREEVLALFDHFKVSSERVNVRYYQDPFSSYIPTEKEKQEGLNALFHGVFSVGSDIKSYWDDRSHMYKSRDGDEELYFNGEYYRFIGEGKGKALFERFIPLSGFCSSDYYGEEEEGIYYIESKDETGPVVVRWNDGNEVGISPLAMSYEFRYYLDPLDFQEEVQTYDEEQEKYVDSISAELFKKEQAYRVRFRDSSELYYFMDARQTAKEIDYVKRPLERKLTEEEIKTILPGIHTEKVRGNFDPETKVLCQIRFETGVKALNGETTVEMGKGTLSTMYDLPGASESLIQGVPVKACCRTVFNSQSEFDKEKEKTIGEHTLPNYYLALFNINGWDVQITTLYKDLTTGGWAENAFLVYRIIANGTGEFDKVLY